MTSRRWGWRRSWSKKWRRRLNASTIDGATILLVEQNAELALGLASRGFVIETGRIVLTDTGPNLLENPKVWASYLGQEDWEFDQQHRARGACSFGMNASKPRED